MKRAQPKRDWSAALEKRDREQVCRLRKGIAGGWQGQCDGPLEAAHIIGRKRDGSEPMRHEIGWFMKVHPDRIVPLCKRHHDRYDGRDPHNRLDLLGYLTPEEEAQAVLDAGSLESARRRLCPSEYARGKYDGVKGDD